MLKIESDKRATWPLNRYQVSDEDPCVLYDIPHKPQVTRIDFSKLPSPRAMQIRPGLTGQIEAHFELPPGAWCSWRSGGQEAKIECRDRFGIGAATQNHLVRRLRALDYIRANFCPGLPEPHLMRRAPKYVQGFIDRHGKPRFYFRRAGFKTVALSGLPWSPEFMAAYEEALAGQPQVGSRRLIAGSMHALAISYYSSAEYLAMKPNSARVRRNIIEKFCRETDSSGQRNGDKRAALLQREHIVRLMSERAAKPESANGLRKALRALMQHAVAMKIRADDPTQGVKRIKTKNKRGYHTWTEAEIEQFKTRHARGSKARKAMMLGLCTGQARQDVVLMGPQHVRDEVLSWVRGKTEQSTGIELFIPVLPELRAELDASPSGHLTYLVTQFGKPFKAAGFGNWFKDQCRAAGLPHCTFHGLRKAASRRLAEHGCTPHEIAAITGHASLKEVERYTKDAARKIMAQAAMAKVRTSSVKPTERFDKTRKKA